MARVLIPIDSTDATVSRLIAKGVTEQLMAHLNFRNIQDITYFERGNVAATQSMNAENEVVKLDPDNYLEVAYKERPVEGAFDVTQFQDDYPAIFACKKLGVYVVPTYLKTEMELTFTYTAKSFNDIRKWLDNYHRLTNTNTGNFLHDVLYNYTIPSEIIDYIYSIHYLSENKAGYGDTLTTFLNRYFTNGLGVRNSLNIASKAIVITSRQNACLGILTTPPEEIEVSEETPVNKISFTYLLRFDKVDNLALDFQCYIHNQRVDTTPLLKYADRRYHQNPKEGLMTASEQALSSINGKTIAEDFYARTYKNRTNECNQLVTEDADDEDTLFIYPIHINELDLHEVCDIHDLVLPQVPISLINICTTYPGYIDDPFFPINIECWSICSTPFKNEITLDYTGKITAVHEMNLRCRYFLRIFLNRNVDCDKLEFMQNDPISIRNLLAYIQSTYQITTIGNDAWITNKSLCEALDIFSKRRNKSRLKMPLVLNTDFIVSKKE